MHKSRQRCGPDRTESTPVRATPDVSTTGPTLSTAYPHGGSCCGRDRIPRLVRTTGYDYDDVFFKGMLWLEIRANVAEATVDAPAHGSKIEGDEQENDEKQFHIPKIGLFAS